MPLTVFRIRVLQYWVLEPLGILCNEGGPKEHPKATGTLRTEWFLRGFMVHIYTYIPYWDNNGIRYMASTLRFMKQEGRSAGDHAASSRLMPSNRNCLESIFLSLKVLGGFQLITFERKASKVQSMLLHLSCS